MTQMLPAVLICKQALLEFLLMQFGKTIRQIEIYDGAWSEETLKQKVLTPPAVFVAWLGSKSTGRGFEKLHDWVIYVIAPIVNATRQRELDSQTIIERIETQLHGRVLKNNLGLIGSAFTHISTENVWSSGQSNGAKVKGGVAFFALRFQNRMEPFEAGISDLPDFLCYFERIFDSNTDTEMMINETHPNSKDGLPEDKHN